VLKRHVRFDIEIYLFIGTGVIASNLPVMCLSSLYIERLAFVAMKVTLDVPAVGGKLVLVDMAGSENVEQAGLGRELKMQVLKYATYLVHLFFLLTFHGVFLHQDPVL
jgi:hypothetical protein